MTRVKLAEKKDGRAWRNRCTGWAYRKLKSRYDTQFERFVLPLTLLNLSYCRTVALSKTLAAVLTVVHSIILYISATVAHLPQASNNLGT